MRVVNSHQVVLAPQRCAVTPFLGPSKGGRWIDSGCHLTDGFGDRVYVHEHSVNEMNRLLGNPSKGEYRQAIDRAKQLEAELKEVRAKLADADRKLAAVHVLKQSGYSSEKKRGPQKVS